jgi:4-hydroxyproline epimerase
VIDSHTGGEPTRVIISGGPDLGSGSLIERRDRFDKMHSDFLSATVNEPRGSDVIVGALLCEPTRSDCSAAVIFYNNVGSLGMCGHGTIGLMVTLLHLGRISLGEHFLETPVGIVKTFVHDAARVTVENVPSYRYRKNVRVEVNSHGVDSVVGDVAWGGNWFFLVNEHQERVAFDNLARLNEVTQAIRRSLEQQGITGLNGAEIDHIELFSPGDRTHFDSRNFVLCPGNAYDRSPCGTGTSAKLACLAADGKLAPGEIWRQASVIGSIFEGSYRISEPNQDQSILPSITGTAYLCSEATLHLVKDDPFRHGITLK